MLDNLEFYHNRLIKLTNGVLLFCSGGEAEITIDLEKHHIIPNTNIMLLPGSILSLRSASPDFQIHYFAYSGEMMKVACFRLDPAFMHFMKENSCYTHTRLETIRPILRMIEASAAIYADKENQQNMTMFVVVCIIAYVLNGNKSIYSGQEIFKGRLV